jgi:hypothetical protein
MKVGLFLGNQFKKAGIDISDKALEALLNLDLDVDDAVATKVDKALFTLDAAKSNPELIKKFKAEALNGADEKMNAILAELGIDPDDDFKGEKNTFERISKLVKLATKITEEKAGAGKMSKDEFTKKEAEYQRQLGQLKADMATKENEFKVAREQDLTTFEINQILTGKEYVFPKEMDAKLKISTAFGAIQAELAKKDLSIKRNAQGQLVILNKEGLPAYNESNVALEPNTFIEGALAQNKLLKINQTDPKPTPGDPINNPAAKGNQAIVSEVDEMLNSPAFK